MNINNNLVSTDQIITNENYGSWMKFDDLEEYKNFINNLKSEIENSSGDIDSILDVKESNLGYTSYRHFYNNLTESDINLLKDSVCPAPMILSSLANKYGIYQIEDTIFRITKYNIFKIINGDASQLEYTNPFLTTETISEGQLPSGIEVIKLYDTSTPLNIVIANGGGYSHRFTREDKKDINGETFKLVATFSLYSVPYYTEFYSKSEFEKKNRKKWITEWATPITLKCVNSFIVSNTPSSNGFKSHSTSQSKDGKREEIPDWYYWDPINPNVTGIDVIGYNSKHTAKRTGVDFFLEIYF
jgi:hypothetical protein